MFSCSGDSFRVVFLRLLARSYTWWTSFFRTMFGVQRSTLERV